MSIPGALRVDGPSQPATNANLPERSRRQGRSPEGPREARRLDLGEHRDMLNNRRLQHGPLFAHITALCASG
jgi:hypothetical protein